MPRWPDWRSSIPTAAPASSSACCSTYAASLERLIGRTASGARAAGQSDVVRRVAHTLKSSSASVGATVFASLCAQVEAATREPQPGTVEPLLDALEAETVRVRRAVHVRLAA